jgi:hypothetical protein
VLPNEPVPPVISSVLPAKIEESIQKPP